MQALQYACSCWLELHETWQWMLAHVYGYDEDNQSMPSACMISQQGRAKWKALHVVAQKMLKHILHGKGWSAPTLAPPTPLVLHRPSWAHWLSYDIIYNVTAEDFHTITLITMCCTVIALY